MRKREGALLHRTECGTPDGSEKRFGKEFANDSECDRKVRENYFLESIENDGILCVDIFEV